MRDVSTELIEAELDEEQIKRRPDYFQGAPA
jgi:hypothetical protein